MTASTALICFEIPGRAQGGVKIYRPKSGQRSFRIVWREHDNRVRERTRLTLAEAEGLAESEAIRLASQTPVRPTSDPLFGELLFHYLEGPGRSPRWTSEKSARRPAQIARRVLTRTDLERPAREYMSPDGRRLLQDILDRAAALGCKPGGWEYAKAGELLRTVFSVADRDDLIDLHGGNPMDHLKFRLHHFSTKPGQRLLTVNYVGPELRPPTQRVREFIDATETMFGSREARYVEVLAFGGLRPGEANALAPDQLGIERPGLWIDRQLMELTPEEAGRAGGETLQIREPKWQTYRNAFYPHELLTKLDAIARSHEPGPLGVLFSTAHGTLRRQNNWRRDVFGPVARHVGWPTRPVFVRGRHEEHFVWPVYGFRHHYANYLLKDLDLPLVTVARFMGHRDARITELMYLKTELDDLDAADLAYEGHKNREAS